MNVKIPAYVNNAIQRVADDLGASKTEVVVALLNEGLDAAGELVQGWAPRKSPGIAAKRGCRVRGCGRPHMAKGYCASHYQAVRRRSA